MNILLVDANISGPDLLATIHPGLKGSHIVTCFSGRSALDIINRGFEPDIAVIDFELPDMSALTLLDMLRLQMNYVYTILLLPQEQRAGPDDAFDAGADDYLLKPIDNRDLALKVKKALLEKGWSERQGREPKTGRISEQNVMEREEALVTKDDEAEQLPALPDRVELDLVAGSQDDQRGQDSFLGQPEIFFNHISSSASEEPQPLPELPELPQEKLSAQTEKEITGIEPTSARRERQPQHPVLIKPAPVPVIGPERRSGFSGSDRKHDEAGAALRRECAEAEVDSGERAPDKAQPNLRLPGKRKLPYTNLDLRYFIGPALKAAGAVLIAALLLFISALSIFLLQNRIGDGVAGMTGLRFYIAPESGDPAIQPGSLLVAGEPDLEELATGDIIVTGSARRGNLFFHQVIGVKTDRRAVMTVNDTLDGAGKSSTVAANDLTGTVYFSLPVLGRLLTFSQTPGGLISLIIIPGALIMFYEASAIHRRYFRGR